ncbi:probable E3 SUMO-protein ligase RNF212 isoform X2 [Panthera uncia]|uniref:probable E3 SUMO-protein ligase RNF212 isoform X2 n=1 Tax=Panthera uncia TaxID=29064 RepID=UPI0020FFDB4F|nr:probable E3 SUMO-protein ligase RNF212 isoform X2 [Panthera uncia]
MASWVFCNRCFQPPHRTSCFSLTNCGHVYCDVCLDKGRKGECLICKVPCRTLLLSEHTDADIRALFMGIDDLCRKYSKETFQALSSYDTARSHHGIMAVPSTFSAEGLGGAPGHNGGTRRGPSGGPDVSIATSTVGAFVGQVPRGPETVHVLKLGDPSTHDVQNHWQSRALTWCSQTAPQRRTLSQTVRPHRGGARGCGGSCQVTSFSPLGLLSHGHEPICHGAEWSFQRPHDGMSRCYPC